MEVRRFYSFVIVRYVPRIRADVNLQLAPIREVQNYSLGQVTLTAKINSSELPICNGFPFALVERTSRH